MNATTTTIPQPAPWSAQALIPRPVERKLTGLPKHRIEPLHNAKALKAVSHAVPLPPLTDYDNPAEPYVPYVFAKPTDTTGWCALSPTVTISLGGIARTDSMRWGFIVDGRSEYVEPVAVHASDTTDWCAIPLNDWRHGCGYAIRDSAAVRFAPDGGLFTNFGVIDGDMEPSQPAPFVPNTAPLVAARERKEADLLIRVKPENDCLHVEPPAVAAPAPNGHQPARADEHVITPTILVDGVAETVEAQQRRRASCTLAHGMDQTKRTVFYDREAVTQ